jgi:uncharacterized protein YjbJ (UPF0337 family)
LQVEIKLKYAKLTDDVLLFVEGKENELLGRLKKELGQIKDDIRMAIEKL